MQNPTGSAQPKILALRLEDFGTLQARYQSLGLARRAAAVLGDAQPALNAAEQILQSLSADANAKQMFILLRKNPLLTGKMRPSEARNMLLDASADFLEGTRHKLAAWRKTMERLSKGEGVVVEKNKEYISRNEPIALAIVGSACVSNFLSIIQLALTELAKTDSKNADKHRSTVAEIRRCSTLLSDCEIASTIDALVH